MRPAAFSAVSRVASLLSLQGAGQVATAVLYLLSMPLAFFYAGRAGRPLPSNIEAAGVFALLLLVAFAGLASLRASRMNREYRGRQLALVAMALGSVTCVIGPPLLLYGLWCYRRSEVRELFARGEAGESAWDIEHAT